MDAEDTDAALMHAAADALRLRLQQAGVTSRAGAYTRPLLSST